MKATFRRGLLTLLSCLVFSSFFLSVAAFANQERPVNFIFLIDVSGSMLYKSEMVQAADGTKVSLFEALRQALEQIARDPRLINSQSQISFITFGTKITEKSDWPSKISNEKDRQALLEMIHSPEQLSADKHGDTYMGGALSQALAKANSLYSEKEPCTTTFIVMLTDGWDEPPSGATVKVRTVAAELFQKQKQMLEKTGVKNWQVLVIGLQTLPDKKAGTTTAKELSGILGGSFIDVTKSSGGTVSERIFLALKQQIEALKGQLAVSQSSPTGKSSVKSGVINFGTVNGDGVAHAVLPLELKSCYAEQITGINDVSATIPETRQREILRKSQTLGETSSVTLSGKLPADAITVKLGEPNCTVAPESDNEGAKKGTVRDISLNAQAHSSCPAGQFFGLLHLVSSATVPEFIPFTVKVPGRIVAEPESIRVKVKKPGVFFAEPTKVELASTIGESKGSHAAAKYEIRVTPESPSLRTGSLSEQKSGKNSVVEATIDVSGINGGKPVELQFDTVDEERKPFKLVVEIPANQKPGLYEGTLTLKVTGSAELVAPSEIPFSITVAPSAWEEVAPIAIPLLIVFVIVCALGLFLWLTNMRRE